MTISAIPIIMVDLTGSILMILLSFLCLHFAFVLKRRDPQNVIWTYLLWVCFGMAGFAVSRSAGHILKQILVLSGQDQIWRTIQPYSGAINTFMLAVVAAITLFFERVWVIYRQILKDKQELQSTRDELLHLNQNLENVVDERTDELARSEHKYRRIFEVSKDMIMVLKADGSIVEINPQGFKMLGYDTAGPSVRDNRFQSFLWEETDWQMLVDAMHQHGFVSNAEIALRRSDGAVIRSLVSGSLDTGPADGDNTIHLLVKDIEQKRLMEAQIAQADKLASIGQLSAGVAHEINNPLGIILGYTQLLLRDKKTQTDQIDDLKIIEKHAKSCRGIITDLLSFSRSSNPEKDVVDIHKIIDEVVTFIQQHSGLDGVQIDKDFDLSVPAMVLDEKKIKQVFINLFMNARHAIGKTGTIKVDSMYDLAANRVLVKVADTGHGIENENLSRIFDPFFTTKPTGEGTGLGLSVSYGIVKNHGGDISVKSRPGKGSTFTIALPVISKTNGNRS